jgi:hypothetical protein
MPKSRGNRKRGKPKAPDKGARKAALRSLVRDAGTFVDRYARRLKSLGIDITFRESALQSFARYQQAEDWRHLPHRRMTAVASLLTPVIAPLGILGENNDIPYTDNFGRLFEATHSPHGDVEPSSWRFDETGGMPAIRNSLDFARVVADSHLRWAGADDFLASIGSVEQLSPEIDLEFAPYFVVFDKPLPAEDPRLETTEATFELMGHREDVTLTAVCIMVDEGKFIGLLGFYNHPSGQVTELMAPHVADDLVEYLANSPGDLVERRAPNADLPAPNPMSLIDAESDPRDLVIHRVPPYFTEITNRPRPETQHPGTGTPASPQYRQRHWYDKHVSNAVLNRMGIEREDGWEYFVRRGRKGVDINKLDPEDVPDIEREVPYLEPEDAQVFFTSGSRKPDRHIYGHGDVFRRKFDEQGKLVDSEYLGRHPDIFLEEIGYRKTAADRLFRREVKAAEAALDM